MFSSSKKPYTAITVQIERLTGPEYEVDDLSGIIDLIEVIRIQDTGPTEAARALRKKLKYGTSHRQLRSLTILDGLIQNGGGRFQRTFADEPLLERLRLLPRDDVVDAEVKEKCNLLFRQWAAHYKGVQGLGGIANLSKELPKKARPTAAQSRVLRETERQAQEDPFHADEDDEPEPSPAQQSLQVQQQQQHDRRRSSLTSRAAGPSLPSASRRPTLVEQIPSNPTTSGTFDALSSKHKKSKSKSKNKSRRQPFDLQRETPKIMQAIASSNIASTNLLNSLKFVNREAGELPSTNKDVMGRFETCKVLRRDVLRYIQLVESEQWIGSLLSANDDLVKALMAWEVLEKGMIDDSDSEVEEAMAAVRKASISNPGAGALAGAENRARNQSMSGTNSQLQGLQLGAGSDAAPPKPPRPVAQPEEPESESDPEEVDEDNPFGDHAAIKS